MGGVGMRTKYTMTFALTFNALLAYAQGQDSAEYERDLQVMAALLPVCS